MVHLISDVIEVGEVHQIGLGGIVLVLEDFRPADPAAFVGQPVEIRLPGGWTLSGEIAEVRDHGPTASIRLATWPDGFPRPRVGWMVEIPAPGPVRLVDQPEVG